MAGNEQEQARALLLLLEMEAEGGESSPYGGGIPQGLMDQPSDGFPRQIDHYSAQGFTELLGQNDQGIVVRNPSNGERRYITPGATAVSDPEQIDRVLGGAQIADFVQDDRDRQILDAFPVASKANEFLRGGMGLGSWIDEAAGAVSPQAQANMRASTAAMQRQRSGLTAGLNAAGAITSAGLTALAAAPAVAVSAPASLGGRVLAGMGAGGIAGATEGSIYGAGEGENVGERIQSAKTGAMIGGGVGAGLGAVLPMAGAGIARALERFKGTDVGTIASELGISAMAARQVRNALESEGAEAAARALEAAGEGAMLADAGPAARSLLDASAQAGGGAARVVGEAVGERTHAATDAMTAALDEILGTPTGRNDAVRAVREGTAEARNTTYDAAYAVPIDYSTANGRALESLLQRVSPAAVRRAEELMRLEGVQSQQIMARIDGETVTFERMPDVRQIDYITRGLRDVAAQADGQGKIGRQTDLGRATGNLASAIRRTLAREVPEYQTALDTAADAISRRNAIDLGYSLLRTATTRNDVSDALRGASQAERAAAKEGLRSFIDDTMANVSRTITDPDTQSREGIALLRALSSRANQAKLQLVLGRSDAARLAEQLDEAATAFELRAAVAMNSATARRQGIQSGVRDSVSGGALQTLRAGEPINATKRIIQALTGETPEAVQLREMGIFEEIATALTQTQGSQARTAMRHIELAMNGQALSERQARLIAAAITSSAALSGSQEASRRLAR